MKYVQQKICGIYCIYNSKYFYVGLSVHIKRRWQQHKYELKNGIHSNSIMQQIYDKFSQEDPFCYKIICECEEKDLKKLEVKIKNALCKKYPDKICMNIAECGGPAGNHPSEETRRKMSEGQIGLKHPTTWVKVVQITLDGEFVKVWDSITDIKNILGIEVRLDYQSNGGYQWQYYDEWVKNPKKKLIYSKKYNTPVQQYDKTGELLAIYESISKASKATGVKPGDISNTINNRQKTAGGFIWKKC